MQPKISIIVPEPCLQSWNEMPPVAGGRFCSVCEKKVIDFTLMSDAGILDVFKKAGANTPCGHFCNSQLGRELVAPTRKTYRVTILQKLAATLILAQAFVSEAFSQSPGHHTTINVSKEQRHLLSVKGQVLDYTTMQPVKNVLVRIIELNLEIAADKNGRFVFSFPDSIQRDSLTIQAIERGIAGNDVKGTVILEEQFSKTFWGAQGIRLFRYPQEVLPAQELAGVFPVVVRRMETTGGAPIAIRIDPVPRPSIWHRLTRPFHKRKNG